MQWKDRLCILNTTSTGADAPVNSSKIKLGEQIVALNARSKLSIQKNLYLKPKT